MYNHSTEDDNADGDTIPPLIRYLNIHVNLFYLIFGNIGNLLKIAFFLQRPLRALPCTVYILLATFSDMVTLNNLPVLQLLIHLYPKYHWIKVAVDWSNYRNEPALRSYSVSKYDLLMCKMRSYLHMLSTDVSSQMLVYASINRFCFTYLRKKRQKSRYPISSIFSQFPHVHKLCCLSLLVSALLSTHHLLNFTVQSASEGCIARYELLWIGWILSIHCCLMPVLMIVFGLLTVNNFRHTTAFCGCLKRYREPTENDRFIQMCSHCIRCRSTLQHKIDKQLTGMIISEIFVTVFTALPYATYTLYYLLNRNRVPTKDDLKRTEWISFFIRMSMYFEATCGFYIYLITLTALRKRFQKIFMEKISAVHCCFSSK